MRALRLGLRKLCACPNKKHSDAEAVLRAAKRPRQTAGDARCSATGVKHRVLGANNPNASFTSDALEELARSHVRTSRPPKPEAGVVSPLPCEGGLKLECSGASRFLSESELEFSEAA